MQKACFPECTQSDSVLPEIQTASTTSKLVVISAVLPSMMLAEQYFSWLMAMARSPVTE